MKKATFGAYFRKLSTGWEKLLRNHAWKVKISHLIDGGDDLMTGAVYIMVW